MTTGNDSGRRNAKNGRPPRDPELAQDYTKLDRTYRLRTHTASEKEFLIDGRPKRKAIRTRPDRPIEGIDGRKDNTKF